MNNNRPDIHIHRGRIYRRGRWYTSRTRSPVRRNAIFIPEESKGLLKEGLILNSKVEYSEGIDFCVICQDEIFLEIIRKLSCKHVYHIKCIDDWFLHNDICPICKRKL